MKTKKGKNLVSIPIGSLRLGMKSMGGVSGAVVEPFASRRGRGGTGRVVASDTGLSRGRNLISKEKMS